MKIIHILLFLLPILVIGQDRKPIKGHLIYRNRNVIAANVVNNTAQLNTITDGEGGFEIPVALGDEVVFSSVQYLIRTVEITPEILKKNRLIITVNEKINALEEVVVTPDNVEKFLDLKEEEFEGYDYNRDKSTKLENTIVTQGQLTNGLNIINIAKLIAKAVGNKLRKKNKK